MLNLVLCYHHVSPTRTRFANSPKTFSNHLEILAEAGYRFLSHDDFVLQVKRGCPGDGRSVLITFDDGNSDSWFHAHPIMVAKQIPSVLFPISSYIGEGPTRAAHEEIVVDCGEAEELFQPMRWSEVREWQDSGLLSVQSHTHSHCDAGDFHGRDEELAEHLAVDIELSLDSIEEHCAIRPTSLAWPWGRNSRQTRAVAEAAGIQYQFNVTPGFNGNWSGADQLQRVCMDNVSEDDLSRWLDRFISTPKAVVYSLGRLGYNRIKSHVKAQRAVSGAASTQAVTPGP